MLKRSTFVGRVSLMAGIFMFSVLGSSAGNIDFYLYQLQVYCGDPQVATAIFTVKGPGSMGTKVICAGKCEGKTVSFEEALAELPAGVSAGLKAELQKHEVKAAAGLARSLANCGSDCDASKYDDYLRKRQAAMELFKHASDLRLTASKLVAEQWGAESKTLGIEAAKEAGGDLAWEEIGPAIDWHLKQRRATLHEEWVLRDKWLVRNASAAGRKAAASAPFAAKACDAIGWVFEIALLARRGITTGADYADYQREAQEATKKAEEMWRKALADFEEFLKQKCAASQTVFPAEDKARLERAKAAIEEWDNNQNLYWDPIRNEAVSFSEAVRRANEYLKSGKISYRRPHGSFVMAAFVTTDDPPGQNELKAAIGELDNAIASWGRLDKSISKYLADQRSIEQKLEEAFGSGSTAASPALPAKKVEAQKDQRRP